MSVLALLAIAFAGFAAQLVDGGLGMGFGATSMTILTTMAGLAPATASAVVNTAQLGTTAASGLSHWKFGNVDWRIVILIGIPGAIGSFVGATVLARLSLNAAQPFTAAILLAIGVLLIVRFASPRELPVKQGALNRPMLGGLGVLGGFISASGGAGWGPVTTSAMLASGRIEPRRVVGTVSTAEFLVTIAAVIGFIFGLWDELLANLAAALALLIGGVIGAPIAAWVISRMNSSLLGGAVGTLLVALNLPKILGLFEVEGTIVNVARVLVIVVGLALSIRGARKRAQLKHVKPQSAHQVDVTEQADPQQF